MQEINGIRKRFRRLIFSKVSDWQCVILLSVVFIDFNISILIDYKVPYALAISLTYLLLAFNVLYVIYCFYKRYLESAITILILTFLFHFSLSSDISYTYKNESSFPMISTNSMHYTDSNEISNEFFSTDE